MSLQIVILLNTHNGRDTHIRSMKIFSYREHKSHDLDNPNFQSAEYTQFQSIR